MMFDATKFGVAVVTDKSFDTLTKDGVNYCYSWTYLNPPANDNEAKKMSEDFLEVLGKNAMVTGYTPNTSTMPSTWQAKTWVLTKILLRCSFTSL